MCLHGRLLPLEKRGRKTKGVLTGLLREKQVRFVFPAAVSGTDYEEEGPFGIDFIQRIGRPDPLVPEGIGHWCFS